MPSTSPELHPPAEVVGADGRWGGGGRQFGGGPMAALPWKRGSTRSTSWQRAQPRFCYRASLPAAIVPEISLQTPTPSRPSLPRSALLISDAMALLTTSAPVNYSEQEGLYTARALNTMPPADNSTQLPLLTFSKTTNPPRPKLQTSSRGSTFPAMTTTTRMTWSMTNKTPPTRAPSPS